MRCRRRRSTSSNGSCLCRANRPNPLILSAGFEHCCDRAPLCLASGCFRKADRSRRRRSVDSSRHPAVRASRPGRADDRRDPGRLSLDPRAHGACATLTAFSAGGRMPCCSPISEGVCGPRRTFAARHRIRRSTRDRNCWASARQTSSPHLVTAIRWRAGFASPAVNDKAGSTHTSLGACLRPPGDASRYCLAVPDRSAGEPARRRCWRRGNDGDRRSTTGFSGPLLACGAMSRIDFYAAGDCAWRGTAPGNPARHPAGCLVSVLMLLARASTSTCGVSWPSPWHQPTTPISRRHPDNRGPLPERNRVSDLKPPALRQRATLS